MVTNIYSPDIILKMSSLVLIFHLELLLNPVLLKNAFFLGSGKSSF